jgi:hypothetical protein
LQLSGSFTRLPQVSSLRLQYTLPITTTPSSWSDILNENPKWDHGVFVISFSTFGGLLLLLYSHFMTRPRNTRICLEINTGFECVLLDVMNLPLCPSYFTIRYPDSITDFKVKGLLSPRLFVNWPNFQVRNKITAHSIMLPASVPISHISMISIRATEVNLVIKKSSHQQFEKDEALDHI